MDLDTVIPVGSSLCRVFGVRHLSPAAAHHLEDVLDALKPTAVLVEGPADASDQIKHLVHKETKPPLAVLAYTKSRPVRTILYPLAEYSPEWVALTWGVRHKADTRFIDLPASVFLQLHDLASRERERAESAERQRPEEEADDAPQTPVADAPGLPGSPTKKPSEHTLAYLDDPHEAIARLSGDPDHETWWERHFEHTTAPAAYAGQIFEFGRSLRELRPGDEENEAREAFMRPC